MKDKFKNIDIEDKKVSNLIQRTNKLVKLLYFLLIIGIILASIVIAKELRIVNFLISILKVLSPLFIGFVIAWLFNPIIKKINDAGIPKILSTDPMAKYLGLKRGDIVKIIRDSETAGKYVTYRITV